MGNIDVYDKKVAYLTTRKIEKKNGNQRKFYINFQQVVFSV